MAYELFDNVTPELVAELTERFKPNYDESGFPNTVPYPGVPEKLKALKDALGCAESVIIGNEEKLFGEACVGKNLTDTRGRTAGDFNYLCGEGMLLAAGAVFKVVKYFLEIHFKYLVDHKIYSL